MSDQLKGAAILGAVVVGLMCLWKFGVIVGIVGAVVGVFAGLFVYTRFGPRT